MVKNRKKITPLVTISIPTFNSERFMAICLEAVKKQTYKNIEVNIIDSFSTDKTITIAKKFNVTDIIYTKEYLMAARFKGVKAARGEYILLLDSDQILEKDAIEKCVTTIIKSEFDMLVLEEDVFRNKTFIEKLFHYDRRLVHSVKDINPYTSVLLPRFFKTSLLRKAYLNVPKKVIKHTMPQDHAIIYLEAWNISKKVGFVPNAVKHIEPDTFLKLWEKYYRWGYYSNETKSSEYDSYFKKRTERLRKGLFKKGLITESFFSLLLLLYKGVPYKIGHVVGKFTIKK